METQKTPQQRMELATSELLRCFNGPDLAIRNISIILRLCAVGMQHDEIREKVNIDIEDLEAVSWLAEVQTVATDIDRLQDFEDVSFDIKRPEWYERERQA